MLQASWDTLNESMTNTTNGNGPGSVGNSNQDFENQNTSNSNDNNPSNPGYRPWEAEVASNHAMSTSQVKVIKMKVAKVKVMDSIRLKNTMAPKNNLVSQARTMHPPPYYAVHPHAMVHHHHHHHLMQVCYTLISDHMKNVVDNVIMLKMMKMQKMKTMGIGNDIETMK